MVTKDTEENKKSHPDLARPDTKKLPSYYKATAKTLVCICIWASHYYLDISSTLHRITDPGSQIPSYRISQNAVLQLHLIRFRTCMIYLYDIHPFDSFLIARNGSDLFLRSSIFNFHRFYLCFIYFAYKYTKKSVLSARTWFKDKTTKLKQEKKKGLPEPG